MKRRRITSGPPVLTNAPAETTLNFTRLTYLPETERDPLADESPPEKNTVLLALEKNMFRHQLHQQLSSKGYKVVTADDAQDALLKLCSIDPSHTVLVLEEEIPSMKNEEVAKMDGYDVLKHAPRIINNFEEIGLIFLSDRSEHDARPVNADVFFQKPVAAREVARAVTSLMGPETNRN
ncbi:MAG: hypothetical protein ABH834_03420 [Candidatus Altiarchaeota archaeon]